MHKNILLFIISLFFISTGINPQNKPSPAKVPAKTEKKETTSEDKEKIKKENETKKEARLKESDQKKAEWIEKTLKYGINQERKEAINYIPTVKDDSKKKLLMSMLSDLIAKESDIGVLVRALNIAGELKLTEAGGNIALQLENQSEDVKIAAVYALKDVGASEKKSILFDKLKSSDFTVNSNLTTAIIETLAEFGSTEIFEFSKERINDNNTLKNYRLSFILYLAKVKIPGSYDFLLKLYKDQNEDADVRGYAVNAISKLQKNEASPEITTIIKEIETYPFEKKKRYYQLYIYSVTALVKLGDSSAYVKLEDSLRNDNTNVRVQAIKLMRELKDQRAADILKYKAEFDPSPIVQKEALAALSDMGVDYKKVLDEKQGKGEKDKKSK